MASPHVFLAPGMFLGTAPFEPLAECLRSVGLTTHLGVTLTTNTKSPGNPSIADNVARCREDVTRAVEDAGEASMIVVVHSAAGHYCSGALEGLGVAQRKAAGKPGGVAHIVYIAAIIVEEGDPEDLTPRGISVESLAAVGLVSVANGQISIVDPNVFFNDLPEQKAGEWATKMYSEPTEGWVKPITYMGWRDIPCHYIVCLRDAMIPPALQEQLAALCGSTVVKMDAGHFPQLSQPAELAQVIHLIASKLN